MKYLVILFTGLVLTSCLDTDNDPVETLTFEEQLDVDIEAIDAYLDANDIEASEHQSGIRFVNEVVGEGNSPTLSDSITVKYIGQFLSNGNVFDQNLDGAEFPLDVLIEAWQIMIPFMNEGGRMIIYAPSGYCYGVFGLGTVIPPNANLIFDIELVAVN